MKKKAREIIDILAHRYPDALCALQYEKDYELMIAVRLSAQCTDARVNLVTPALFERFPTAKLMAAAEAEDVEPYIRSCGLYKTKARDLVAMARMLCEKFGGQVPATMEELTSLPGIGRKTANLICGDVYGQVGTVVADTHCIRITNRLGLTEGKDPYRVELQLRKLLPPEESNAFCHRLVLFGRDVCIARAPQCDVCPLGECCPSKETAKKQAKKS